jgi:hypothetical protein
MIGMACLRKRVGISISKDMAEPELNCHRFQRG